MYPFFDSSFSLIDIYNEYTSQCKILVLGARRLSELFVNKVSILLLDITDLSHLLGSEQLIVFKKISGQQPPMRKERVILFIFVERLAFFMLSWVLQLAIFQIQDQ